MSVIRIFVIRDSKWQDGDDWFFFCKQKTAYEIPLRLVGSGAVQRELARLAQSGLVTVKPVGNQKHYQANPWSPIYEERCSMVRKTVGMAEPLRAALAPLAAQIKVAFVYGSIAKQQDTARSDIDLMLVSANLGYADVFGALEDATQTLGRNINPTLYTPADFARRIAQDNAFVTRVLEQPKIWLIEAQEPCVGQMPPYAQPR